jgi:hypothetical protein
MCNSASNYKGKPAGAYLVAANEDVVSGNDRGANSRGFFLEPTGSTHRFPLKKPPNPYYSLQQKIKGTN